MVWSSRDKDSVQFLTVLCDLAQSQLRCLSLDQRERVVPGEERRRKLLPRRAIHFLLRIVDASATSTRHYIDHAIWPGLLLPVEGFIKLPGTGDVSALGYGGR